MLLSFCCSLFVTKPNCLSLLCVCGVDVCVCGTVSVLCVYTCVCVSVCLHAHAFPLRVYWLCMPQASSSPKEAKSEEAFLQVAVSPS